MKKKAHSLLEIMICLGLSVSIFCGGLYSLNGLKRFYENIEIRHFSKALISYIYDCKSYCKANNIEGNLCIQHNKDLKLYCGMQAVSTLNVPKNIKINSNSKINIDKKGFTSSSCTIYLTNKRKGKKITITVATGALNEKNN
ncbi:hypothetical protein ACER0A_007530 [Haloimpatiens sp. FM7315]|uniref:hypothetical protein n=1 Tax=Haloimpatiens sp. FM7315 TaxID=3298609 RepID=UPI00370C698E